MPRLYLVVLAAVGLGLTARSASAAFVVNQTQFNAALASGTSFTEGFALPGGPSSPPNTASNLAPGVFFRTGDAFTFSGSGLSFTVTAPGTPSPGVNQFQGDSRRPDVATGNIGNDLENNPLLITFGSGVTAAGGTFFISDEFFTFRGLPVTLRVTESDGSVQDFGPTTPGSPAGSFQGILADPGATLVSIELLAPANTSDNFGEFNTIDSLTVGRVAGVNAIPVPPTAVAAVLGGLTTAAALRRRRVA